jgi:hypothetical protein
MPAKRWAIAACTALVLVLGCGDSMRDDDIADHDDVMLGGGTTVRGEGGQRISLSEPSDVSIKLGETERLTVRVNRENYGGPVTISFHQLPEGIEIVDSPRETTLDQEVFVVRTRPDAALVENHMARVTVEGPDGISATETFEFKVKQ